MFDRDWSDLQVKRHRLVVMASRAQVCTLRNADITFKRYLVQIIDPDLPPDPTVIANTQFPRILDADVWVYDNTLSDLCTKQAEDGTLQFRHRKPATLKQNQANVIPNSPYQNTATRIVKLVSVGTQVTRRQCIIDNRA